MNAILSLILSFVLAFGGGAMPAVPETVTTYTVDNIVLTVDDDTVVLNPTLMLSLAAGSEQLQAQFGIEMDGEILLPLAGEISSNGVKFLLNEGRAYALDAATLNELTGMTEPDAEVAVLLQEFGELAALIPEIQAAAYDLEENWAMSEKLLAKWIEESGAAAETFDVEVNGVTVPVTGAQLNITAEMAMSSLDMVRSEGSEVMQAYAQQILDLLNLASGSQYASFAEFFAAQAAADSADAEAAMSASFPMELTYGKKDGLYYSEAFISTEIEGVGMDVNAVNVSENGVTEMTMNMTMGDEDMTIGVACAAAYDTIGNMSVNFDLAVNGGYEGDTVDGQLYSAMNTEVAEDGLKNSEIMADFSLAGEVMNVEDGSAEVEEANISLNWTSAEHFEEDGSVTADCELVVSADDGVESHALSLAFALNRAEAPFADVFAIMEMVNLPADPEDEAYEMLSSELFGPLSDLMVLSMDESVTELIEMFSALAESMVAETEEVYAYTADSYAGSDDPAYIDEEYLMDEIYYDEDSYDFPEYSFSAHEGGELDLAAAAEAYGSEIPEFTVPEGYTLEWMYASEEYCSLDFTSGDHYFSATFYPVYEGTRLASMRLNEDGSLAALEGNIAQVQFNEDGTVLYIDFISNGTQYSLYMDSVAVEDMQQYLSCFMG